MFTTTSLSILPASQIDKSSWDACVAADSNSLIYNYSWYLDTMADDWLGVVYGAYEGVLPIPIKNKFGVKHVYMPPFIQRFQAAGNFDYNLLANQYHLIKKWTSLIMYNCADSNFLHKVPFKTRPNFILPLSNSYESLVNGYTASCKRNIKKAKQRGCILSIVSFDEVRNCFQAAYGNLAAYKKHHFDRLKCMLENEQLNSYFHLLGVRHVDSGALLYAGLLLDDGNRIYYLLGAPNNAGKEARATTFFIDAMIEKFALQRQYFDFEGSSIPSVASFYKSFNPQEECYFQYYINEYPQPLRFILDKLLQK